MNHASDVETRILPLQWAIDKVRSTFRYLDEDQLTRMDIGDNRARHGRSAANTIGIAVRNTDECPAMDCDSP